MDRIDNLLQQRKNDNLLRALRPADAHRNGRIYFNGTELIDFSSNDYLGFADHDDLKKAAKKAVEQFALGSSASRLLSGDLKIHHELEEKTARLKGKESALLFNTGYQANLGIISALYQTGDAVFCDKLSHASILDGITLSGAKGFRFRHNDAGHLESLLKKNAANFENRLIVTESVFSMDGDKPPLKDLIALKEKYDCLIMVDEAHATGIFSPKGSGVVAEFALTDKVDLIMGTFSKALGSFGAYVAASKKTIQYLINTSRSFIYSTALPPAVIAVNIAALEILETEPDRRKTLLENAAYFRDELKRKGFNVTGCSQIVPLILGDAQNSIALSEYLLKKGYFALPIRPPTVPANQSRLRFSLTYHHSRETLNDLLKHIGNTAHV